MRQAKTGWKWTIALFSLLLTVLIWQQGLQESFERPSVAPKISLMQTEMAVSASSSLSETIQEVFLGSEPQKKLYQALSDIPFEQIDTFWAIDVILVKIVIFNATTWAGSFVS